MSAFTQSHPNLFYFISYSFPFGYFVVKVFKGHLHLKEKKKCEVQHEKKKWFRNLHY